MCWCRERLLWRHCFAHVKQFYRRDSVAQNPLPIKSCWLELLFIVCSNRWDNYFNFYKMTYYFTSSFISWLGVDGEDVRCPLTTPYCWLSSRRSKHFSQFLWCRHSQRRFKRDVVIFVPMVQFFVEKYPARIDRISACAYCPHQVECTIIMSKYLFITR